MASRSDAAQHLSDLERLRRVRDRIDREYARPLDVEALARGAYMSAGHLSRQSRLAYGESPYVYVMTRRIERVMALLRRGDLSVTDDERTTIAEMMAKGTYAGSSWQPPIWMAPSRGCRRNDHGRQEDEEGRRQRGRGTGEGRRLAIPRHRRAHPRNHPRQRATDQLKDSAWLLTKLDEPTEERIAAIVRKAAGADA